MIRKFNIPYQEWRRERPDEATATCLPARCQFRRSAQDEESNVFQSTPVRRAFSSFCSAFHTKDDKEREEPIAHRIFTSESVTEGHPDKVCDQISDAVLDAILAQDPYGRVACETVTTTGLVMVMG